MGDQLLEQAVLQHLVSTFLPVQHSIALLLGPTRPSFDAFQLPVGSTTLFLAQVELLAAVAGLRVAAFGALVAGTVHFELLVLMTIRTFPFLEPFSVARIVLSLLQYLQTKRKKSEMARKWPVVISSR